MTNEQESDAAAGWRLASASDIPFVYELVTRVDPRWWRFSKGGLEPAHVLASTQAIAAGVIVYNGGLQPVACAILTDAGTSGTGTLEYFALPDESAQALARAFAPAIVNAAFKGATIRRLYHERFEGDPQILGEMADLFEVEVTYPRFALVGGTLETRTISVLSRERLDAWNAQTLEAMAP
ncbi:MAG: hypothetical protein Q7V57_08225 [Actinomycetota bacterium]|nr:hypothetical protein [Actinomycetota bacterium]